MSYKENLWVEQCSNSSAPFINSFYTQRLHDAYKLYLVGILGWIPRKGIKLREEFGGSNFLKNKMVNFLISI